MEKTDSSLEDENTKREARKKQLSKSKTPFIDSFGKDLTQLALDGKLENVIGREEEIQF